jgi:hypothetical protein
MAATRTDGRRASAARRPSRANGAQGRARANGRPQETAEATPEKSPGTLQQIASKAKGPALAGGAALAGVAGVAGAVALARNQHSKRSRLPLIGKKLPSVSLPKLSNLTDGAGDSTRKALGATAKAVGEAAVEVGKAGFRVGELASEVRRVREQAAQRDG